MSGSTKLLATTSLAILGAAATSGSVLSAIAVIKPTEEPAMLLPYVSIAIVGIVAMAWAARALAYANEWVEYLPVKSYLSPTAIFGGFALGAFVPMLLIDELPLQITAGVVAAVAALLTLAYLRRLRAEIQETKTERARISWLRDHGRRLRANVIDAYSTGVWAGGLLMFHVAVEYETRSGVHEVHERLLAAPNDAPTVGGTVLLWVSAYGSDPTDVLMELDADSIRHPDPSEFWSAPGPETGGFGSARV
ncbi:MAG TPA: hypothetical protein DIW46_00690 [Microbacterium sp.]|nr:hypothetical protein [Microbacterium sp.]